MTSSMLISIYLLSLRTPHFKCFRGLRDSFISNTKCMFLKSALNVVKNCVTHITQKDINKAKMDFLVHMTLFSRTERQ